MVDSRVKWWQRVLSYFREVELAHIEGEYNPSLHVSLVQNRFQLSTANAIYSFDDLYLNFYRAFQQLPMPPSGARMLLLGLGLGSVPFMLEKKFRRFYNITAVEFDESVIELATLFTLPRLTEKMQVIHADAEVFVKLDDSKYDLIIVDLFLDDIVPPYFNGVEGMKRLRHRLAPDGKILVNRLYRNESDKERTEQFYNKVFKRSFRDSSYIDVKGNWILVGSA